MPVSAVPISYCGPPPSPDSLWVRWNPDPVLLAAMATAICVFLLARNRSARDNASFFSGMAVLAIIFISPLCALTVALFSARVVHHVLLVAVAAPLLAWSLIGRLPPNKATMLPALIAPLLLLHTALFWLWHAPSPYALALASHSAYWAMQTSLLASAAMFWAAVMLAPPARAIMALLAASVQMGLLGALLVFAGQPLYPPHLATTLAFGLDPLADQQLAGLIMWVPASLPYLLVAALRLTAWLRQGEVRRA
jgi:putative membrane protein